MRAVAILSAAFLVSYCGSAVHAQSENSAPNTDLPCNDLCAWWMSIGRTPNPVARAAPEEPADGVERASRPGGGGVRLTPALARPALRHDWARASRESLTMPLPHPTPVSTESPARRPGTLWGVPLGGSAPILAAAFAPP